MRSDTRSFYEAAVERTVTAIVGALDEALDLSALAKGAALSPFHFHRVFRGMLGETPLELHRRLRLERAAHQLLQSAAPVTTVAFDAGYETHEAFTRAFRAAYGAPPSAFRQAEPLNCRPSQIELPARSGIHFNPEASRDGTIRFNEGGQIVTVDIETKREIRVATVRHVGPYQNISEAFARLGKLATAAGLMWTDESQMLAIYYDDPETKPADQLESDAGVTVPEGLALPSGMVERRLPAGRYAKTTHVGPYTRLGDVWGRLMGEWLPKSGHRVGDGSAYEVYRNNPGNAAPEDLRTDLYLPLA